MAELESLKIDLEVKIAREEIQTQILTKDQVKLWLKNMEKLDLASIDNRQRIINTFVNSIYVYEDRFEVNFNCREGFETIPLDIERFVSRLEIVGEPFKHCSDSAFLLPETLNAELRSRWQSLRSAVG